MQLGVIQFKIYVAYYVSTSLGNPQSMKYPCSLIIALNKGRDLLIVLQRNDTHQTPDPCRHLPMEHCLQFWLVTGHCSASSLSGSSILYHNIETRSTNSCKQHVRLENTYFSCLGGYFVQDHSFKVEHIFQDS